MCIYGIELLADNIVECRANLLEIFSEYLNLNELEDFYRAAFYVLSQNLVHDDALTMRTQDDRPITFAEWAISARASSSGGTSASRLVLPHRLSARRVRCSLIWESMKSSRRPKPTRR